MPLSQDISTPPLFSDIGCSDIHKNEREKEGQSTTTTTTNHITSLLDFCQHLADSFLLGGPERHESTFIPNMSR
jgi:hypothetical protein